MYIINGNSNFQKVYSIYYQFNASRNRKKQKIIFMTISIIIQQYKRKPIYSPIHYKFIFLFKIIEKTAKHVIGRHHVCAKQFSIVIHCQGFEVRGANDIAITFPSISCDNFHTMPKNTNSYFLRFAD